MSEPVSLPCEERALQTERLRRGERLVLGVVFPYVDAVSPRSAELERTFLQLAYAVHRLADSGAQVSGYFAVLQQEIRDAVQRLRARYETGDSVRIVFTSLLVSDLSRLADAAEAASKEGNPLLFASVAREIGMETLSREIAAHEPGVVVCSGPEEMPFGVPWDFYGKAREA